MFSEDDVVTIFISKKDGDFITDLVDDGLTVTMHIRVGTVQPPSSKDVTHHNAHNISKTSVLFVSISFIVLMIISLAWLVFYYIQRFRYAHAKERLSVSIIKQTGVREVRKILSILFVTLIDNSLCIRCLAYR